MKNINNSLSVVLLDDDKMELLQLEQIITTHHLAKISATYDKPNVFLKEFSMLDFDILILDCDMPGISGREIVEKIGGEHCIISTGSKDKYEEAIKCHPIDILIKPASEFELYRTFEKAKKILSPSTEKNEYYLFKTLEKPDKISIKIHDILYIHTYNNSRRKIMTMRNGVSYTLFDYSMDELLGIAPHLLRPNQSELVAIDIIESKGHDYIYLTICDANAKNKWVSVGRSFKKSFDSHYKNCRL